MSTELGSSPHDRRRGALRGVPALPVPSDVQQEPVPLAVRRFGPPGAAEAGTRRRRHHVAADFLVDGARDADAGGAVPAVAAPPRRTSQRPRPFRHPSTSSDRRDRIVADLGRGGGARDLRSDRSLSRPRPTAGRCRDGRRRQPTSRTVDGGRLVRERHGGPRRTDRHHRIRRRPVRASPCASATPARPPRDERQVQSPRSMIGTHVIAEVVGGEFVSLLEPPRGGDARSSRCHQHRCFPCWQVDPGERRPSARVADHPLRPPRDRRTERGLALRLHRDRRDPDAAGDDDDRRREGAGQSDRPAAARIIDRCDSMSPESMQQLHGVLRDPHAGTVAAGLSARDSRRCRLVGSARRHGGTPRRRRRAGERGAVARGQPGPAASVAAGRRPGHLLRREDRPRHLGSRGRRRATSTSGSSSRTTRPPRCTTVWPLPLLRAGRDRTASQDVSQSTIRKRSSTWR